MAFDVAKVCKLDERGSNFVKMVQRELGDVGENSVANIVEERAQAQNACKIGIDPMIDVFFLDASIQSREYFLNAMEDAECMFEASVTAPG